MLSILMQTKKQYDKFNHISQNKIKFEIKKHYMTAKAYKTYNAEKLYLSGYIRSFFDLGLIDSITYCNLIDYKTKIFIEGL